MLALRNPNNNSEVILNEETTSCGFAINVEEFPEFADHGALLDSIDFDDLFGGIDGAGDSLPDLEILSSTADFSDQAVNGDQEDVVSTDDTDTTSKKTKYSPSPHSSYTTNRNNPNNRSNRSKTNNNEGKRKVKVDWTGELHRRFVEAVEKLGVEKAVPSRILELMNVRSLTRHNVASHLQKYRSHRKHMLAREAEAANWTRKRQMYVTDAPTMGFPQTHFRPLHVWGHPTALDLWPKHTPPHPPFWHPIPNGTTPGTPCFPATPPTRFGAPTVAGIPQPPPPHLTMQSGPRPPLDLHPSKESVDAAIGEVLRKPTQPLPLGLKPPSVDSVMTELHRHGVSHVPPTAPCA